MDDSPHPIPRILKPFGWLLLALLVVFCTIPQASTVVFTWPWSFYSQLLLISPAFVLAGLSWVGGYRFSLAGLAAAFTAAAIATSVLFSRQPHFSLEAALPLWGGLAWTFLAADIVRRHRSDPHVFRRFARVVGVLMLCPLLCSIYLYAIDLAAEISRVGTWRIDLTNHRNPYPLGHWNYTGGLVLLTLPWFIGLAVVERGVWRRLWVGGGLLALVVFVSASSRGAVIGALAGLAAAAAMYLGSHRPSRAKMFWVAAAGVAMVSLLFATNPRLRELVVSPSSVRNVGEGDVQRLGMAQAGLLLGSQRPWIGHGPGMVPFVYPEVRAQLVGGVETSYQLHNGPLHWWVITGVAGVVGLLAMAVAGWQSVIYWHRSAPDARRTFALASGCALAAYAAFAITDFQGDVIAILALLGLHFGVVVGGRPARLENARPSAPYPFPGRCVAGLLAVAGILVVWILVPHWKARSLQWTALVETPAPERVRTAELLQQAVAAAPWCTHYRNQIGCLLARSDLLKAPGLVSAARAILRDSLAIDPAQEPVHSLLGWLWLADDPAAASSHFEAASRLIPDRPSNNLGQALSCISLNDLPRAQQALAMEMILQPSFAYSPLWREQPLVAMREECYKQWLELENRFLSSPELPDRRKPSIVYARAVVRWWAEGRIPTGPELDAASADQRAFWAYVAGGETNSALLPQRWRVLDQALREPTKAAELLGQLQPAISPAAVANTISRISKLDAPHSLVGLLRSPVPEGAMPSVVRIDRVHYTLMHRNLDGPAYADLAPYVEDTFLGSFLTPLLPPRFSLPGPVLVHLMQGTAAASAGD